MRAAIRLVSVPCVVGLLLAAGIALGAERFSDPSGDVEGGPGPDIVGVTVSQPVADRVSFAVEFATAPPLAFDVAQGYTDMLMIGLDSTLPLKDGPEAWDYVIGAHGANLDQGAALAAMANGRNSGPVRLHVVTAAVEGRTLTLTLPLDAIGNPSQVRFTVGAGREGPDAQTGGSDSYPDPGGQTYSLAPQGPSGLTWLGPIVIVTIACLFLVIALRLRRGGTSAAAGGPS